ncbi:hypothetical protein BGZ63DRAFT_382012 [Mariannaea sp. PMI_226]|nr:hypothetical protein BGZ63DRAFT_382012 [Mariannaea sp. PMI_226]
MGKCAHAKLYTDCSPVAAGAGFRRPSMEKRIAATTLSGRQPSADAASHQETLADPWTFPAPLVLPDDDLALDPQYPPQSFKSWLSYNKKMPVAEERKAIYVVATPQVMPDVRALMKDWEIPKGFAISPTLPQGIASPRMDDVCEYLGAFYHGMDIKKHEGIFKWQKWDSEPSKKGPKRLGLATPKPSEELIGVRFRPSPDGIARMQVNLNDILDALIDRVPIDAYAIVMLCDYDLYEDDDDDFCCGRAYGESRIAIVSSFRYTPLLDSYSGIQLDHMWPASHCKRYVDRVCSQDKRWPEKSKTPNALPTPPNATLVAAANAYRQVPLAKTRDELAGLWFSRVARTASHELGHCLGMDHCVYYACVMQGTADMIEDVRQPPYLCPICLSKLSWALSGLIEVGTATEARTEYVKQRYEAIEKFCANWQHVSMFAAYQVWVEKRLEQDIIA